jgi:hypothetical protein
MMGDSVPTLVACFTVSLEITGVTRRVGRFSYRMTRCVGRFSKMALISHKVDLARAR